MDFITFFKPDKNKYFEFRNSGVMPCDSAKQINNISNMLSHYAKVNGVKIEIFDPRDRLSLQKYVPNSDLAACIGISVYDKNFKKPIQFDVIDYFKEEKTPLIKRIYKSVQKLVTGDTMLPIEKHKSETMTKLIKSGKLKV